MRPLLHQVRVPSLPRRRRQWPVGSSAATGTWIVNGGALAFTQGDQTPFNVAATGPAGYVAGGVYSTDPVFPALPAGMVLTDAGSLTVGSAGAQSVAGVKFSYHEPGGLSTLTLHPNITGTLPYLATAYPAEGHVPSGSILVSPDDANLRSSVLSTWPDGSAQVVVLAGLRAVTASVTQSLRLRPAVVSEPALTTTAVAAAVSSIAVNFGGGVGTLSNFGSPDRVWWANSQVICARYRLAIPGKGSMEAVIDVHAFAGGQAFVEVVVENGQVNANAATVTGPSTQTYTGATVSVNGTTIATVSSPTANMLAPRGRNFGGVSRYQGGHTAFRAWYCAAKVVGGVVNALTSAQAQAEVFGIEVTHDTASLQAHPWFWKPAVAPSENLQNKYSQSYDTYEPWALGRLRLPGMNEGSDDEEIGLFTGCQSDYAITGNRFARRAVLVTGLAPLSLDFSWRHTDGSVPTRAQALGKTTSGGTWPINPEPNDANNYAHYGTGNSSYIDGSHIPSIALVPFLCRPSPCFIEIAQKEFLWNHTNYGSTQGWHHFDQIRARAWRVRNYAFAAYLTPDSDATRKADYRTVLALNAANILSGFYNQSWNALDVLWFYGPSPEGPINRLGSGQNYPDAEYMMMFCAFVWAAIDRNKVLRGADATTWSTLATTALSMPVRMINETTSGAWRLCTIDVVTGTQVGSSTPVTLNQGAGTWGPVLDATYAGTVPGPSGTWLTTPDGSYAGATNWSQTLYNPSYNYPQWRHFALAAAVDHGIAGADAAWSKMRTNITNYSTWLGDALLSSTNKYNRTPRTEP